MLTKIFIKGDQKSSRFTFAQNKDQHVSSSNKPDEKNSSEKEYEEYSSLSSSIQEYILTYNSKFSTQNTGFSEQSTPNMTPESKSESSTNSNKFKGDTSAKNLFNSENGHSKYFKDNFESKIVFELT